MIDLSNPHRLLREVLRHYLSFESYFKQTGEHVIEYAGVQISFLDLQDALLSISPRKKQAVWLNVVKDQKQKDVADEMGIRTVTVGQYVDQGLAQIAKVYFAELYDEENDEFHLIPTGARAQEE